NAHDPQPGLAPRLERSHFRASRRAPGGIRGTDDAAAGAVWQAIRKHGSGGMTPDLDQRAARVRLLLMDVDGVLTDGHLINVPGPGGDMVETKAFDSQDGIALQWLNWHGIAS